MNMTCGLELDLKVHKVLYTSRGQLSHAQLAPVPFSSDMRAVEYVTRFMEIHGYTLNLTHYPYNRTYARYSVKTEEDDDHNWCEANGENSFPTAICLAFLEIAEQYGGVVLSRRLHRSQSCTGLKYYLEGKPLGVSTDIVGNVTYGYGKLDDHGFWEFPITPEIKTKYKSFYEERRQERKSV